MSDASSKTLSFSSYRSASQGENSTDLYLKLSKPVAIFETNDDNQDQANVVSIFFDQVLNQLFVVRSHGATGVSSYSASLVPSISGALYYPQCQFKISSPFFGPIRSIKQSPDGRCLSIKRANQPNQIEFLLPPNETADVFEYAFYQSCKAKNSKLQDFYWVGNTQLLIVTNMSLEYYCVNIAKKACKVAKTISMNVAWAIFHRLPSGSRGGGTGNSPSMSAPDEYQGLLVVSTSDQQNVVNPFIFKSGSSSGSVVKLAKFEVDMPMSSKRPGQKQQLLESDLSLLTIYEETYVSVIRRQPLLPHPHSSAKVSSELVLYRVSREAPANKAYVLRLSSEAGLFAVNVVDNLVVVHYQEMQISMLFDVKLSGESDGFTTFLNPILTPPGSLAKAEPVVHPNSGKTHDVKLYDKAWVVFRPDVIINTQIGAMWRLTLDLRKIAPKFTTNSALLRFLQLRYNSRQLQLDLFKKFFSEKTVTLAQTATLFDISNDAYKRFFESERSQAKEKKSSRGELSDRGGLRPFTFHDNSVLHQSDMLTIFVDMLDQPVVSPDRSKFIVAVILEFIKSLEKMRFQVDYKVEDVLVSHLVRTQQFYQLHQLLQFYVITDRQLMACKLLSLHEQYPAAIQLALDMFKRLGQDSHSEILELLLSRQEVITAIKFAKKFYLIDDLRRPEKFLEVAKITGDRILYYAVYKFFEEFNFQQSSQRSLFPSAKCVIYTRHFEELFGRSSLEEHKDTMNVGIAKQLSVI